MRPGQTDRIVLNVAGPRESGSPDIFERAKKTLLSVFTFFRNYSGGDLSAIDDNGNLVAWIDAEFVGVDAMDDDEEEFGDEKKGARS